MDPTYPITWPWATRAPDLNASGEAAQMAVPGDDPAAVPDLDQVAVSAGPSRPGDDAVARGHDRRAGIGGVVGAFVPPADAEYRVKPRAREARGDATELHRRPEECPPQRVAGGVVVGRSGRRSRSGTP